MEKNSKKKIGELGYINENCWLAKALNYAPYERCQYCELKFGNCVFLHYQIISLILIFFFLTISLLIDGKNSKLVIISVFTLVIVYGYFFNRSTDKVIKSYFAERRAKEAFEGLSKNLQQKVEEQTKDIKVLSEMKSEFLKIVNHQLRTPMSIIMGYLSMMQEGSIRGQTRMKEVIDNTYLSSQRLITILDDLLNAQELVGERTGLNLRFCQIEEIISRVVEHFQFFASQKKLSLTFEKPKQPLPKTLLDEEGIERALKKIIDNAILYTDKGGITITANLIKENKKDFIQIKVKDAGMGIIKEDMEKIFKIFSRGKEGVGRHPNGSGLGLFIAKEYVEAHQGRIEAQSEGKDQGAVFTITLPIITEV